MPQLADHQLMALIELSPLDRSGNDVCNRRDEGGIVIVKFALLRAVCPQDAIGAAVAAGDRRSDAADDAMLMQQRVPKESAFLLQIFRNDGPAGSQRISSF